MTTQSQLILNSPVARGFEIIGDRWTSLILREAFLGASRFQEFLQGTGAARGTLTLRLNKLVENGLLYKRLYQESPPRYDYRLTEKGFDLYPSALAIWDWETRWSKDSDIPSTLTHRSCGRIMRPLFLCGACRLPIRIREVTFQAVDSPAPGGPDTNETRRRSTTNRSSVSGVDRKSLHVLDIIGDRWTGLVIAALYFGLRRYDSIAEALAIATNILANRLKLLVSAKMVVRVPYQKNPVRYDYRLTERGRDLYLHTLQIHQWANRWVVQPGESPLVLKHTPCGHELLSEVVCGECREPLNYTDIEFDRSFLPARKSPSGAGRRR
jgi:DNA-binding HxlR family transcriptional regulator